MAKNANLVVKELMVMMALQGGPNRTTKTFGINYSDQNKTILFNDIYI